MPGRGDRLHGVAAIGFANNGTGVPLLGLFVVIACLAEPLAIDEAGRAAAYRGFDVIDMPNQRITEGHSAGAVATGTVGACSGPLPDSTRATRVSAMT